MSEPQEMATFLAALEMAPAARAAFVAALADPKLRARITHLLAIHDELGDDEPLAALPKGRADASRLLGVEVDGYRITNLIGRGGMGVVYEAQQEQPRRRVALKTLPLAGGTRDADLRLEREASLLAKLSHPGIAHVYGFGRAAALDGMPFLAMELIDGLPLDRFSSEADLSIRARLHLLADLADAVGHAHARGVVHRDLKPANVLVRADGAVKVLDFGIARLLDDDRSRMLATRTGEVLGTLPYMSPEQVRGDPAAVDTRTDVYALGALGYQLLADRLPLPTEGLSLARAMRRIEHEEPRPLGDLRPALAGDVETLIGKAMDKDPARRYADAGEFAADLRRHLTHEPILARAPSRTYLVSKFVRRHRLACGAALAVVAALAVGTGWAMIERDAALAAKIDAERSAELERQRARSAARMTDVVWDLVARATPQEHGGRPPSIERVVEELAGRADAMLADDPWVLGHTHLLLNSVSWRLGDRPGALQHLARARELLAEHPLRGPRETVELAWRDANVSASAGRFDHAIEQLEGALEMARTLADDRLELRMGLALANQLTAVRRDLPRAERLVRQVLERGEVAGHTALADDAARVLARTLDAQDRLDEAAAAYAAAITNHREHLPGSLDLANLLQNFGLLRDRQHRPAEALALLREALAVRREVFGETPHAELAIALDNLACTLRDRGENDEALVRFDEAAAMFAALGDVDSPDLAVCLTERAIALRRAHRTTESRRDLERAIAIFDAADNTATTQQAAALEQLALTMRIDGDARAALPFARRAVAMRREVHGRQHFLVARALDVLAFLCFTLEDDEATLEAAGESLRLRRAAHGDAHPETFASAWLVWRAHARRGEVDAATTVLELAAAGATARGEAGRSDLRKHLAELVGMLRVGGREEAVAAVEARLAELDPR